MEKWKVVDKSLVLAHSLGFERFASAVKKVSGNAC